MDDVRRIAAELAQQRADLEAEKERRHARGEDLSVVLLKLAELRSRMEKVRPEPAGDGDSSEMDIPADALRDILEDPTKNA